VPDAATTAPDAATAATVVRLEEGDREEEDDWGSSGSNQYQL
jgi:hypothetical protein